ncbi:MAG: ABC transporter ATP-binding protein [Sulfolobaceae archaeon]
MKDLITVRNLWKIYKGGIIALKDVSFSIEEGDFFALLGPNGAGKTTLIKILSCVIKPSKGEIIIKDYSVPEECKKVRKIIGVVPQDFHAFGSLTVRDIIEYFGKLYGSAENVDSIIDYFGLRDYEKVKYDKLSGGLKRRVGIVCGIINNPEILFLDEPTIGLDVRSRRDLWKLIKDLNIKNKTTILLTTHYMEEAEALAKTIGVIYKGSLIRITTPETLKEEFKSKTLEDAYLELIREIEEEK